MNTTEPELSPVAALLAEAVRELRLRGQVEERLTPAECAARAKVDESTIFGWKREWVESGGVRGLGPWAVLGKRSIRIRASVFERFLRGREA